MARFRFTPDDRREIASALYLAADVYESLRDPVLAELVPLIEHVALLVDRCTEMEIETPDKELQHDTATLGSA